MHPFARSTQSEYYILLLPNGSEKCSDCFALYTRQCVIVEWKLQNIISKRISVDWWVCVDTNV